jgi:hypothetical protein
MRKILKPVLCSALICLSGLLANNGNAKTKIAPAVYKLNATPGKVVSSSFNAKKLYNEYVIAITISHNTGSSYTATIHFGESDSGTGDAPIAAPTAITVNISLTSSLFTGPLTYTLPAGSSSISENFTSTTTPSAFISSVSPNSYGGFPIIIVTS